MLGHEAGMIGLPMPGRCEQSQLLEGLLETSRDSREHDGLGGEERADAGRGIERRSGFLDAEIEVADDRLHGVLELGYGQGRCIRVQRLEDSWLFADTSARGGDDCDESQQSEEDSTSKHDPKYVRWRILGLRDGAPVVRRRSCRHYG